MSSSILTTISPITNLPITTRPALTPSDIPALTSRALTAFKSFRYTHPLPARQKLAQDFLTAILSHKDDLASCLTTEMGRPTRYAVSEIRTMVSRGEYLLSLSTSALSDVPGVPEPGFKRFIRKEPVGVVLVIFAWNYPYLILVNSLIPAILAGNTVILKGSPQTPSVVEKVVKLFNEVGLPENVLQYVHCGDAAVIEQLIQSPEISLVAFTGSHAGGIAVQKAASERTIPITLELGGNDPAYVRGDVDVAWAAEEIVEGAVFNSGQSCCAIERIYVHESIYEEFCQKVVEVIKGYKLGDPRDPETTIGPVISAAAASRIRADVQDALSKGAKRLTPEGLFAAAESLAPTFVGIEILRDCNHSMNIMTTETFGPTIPIMPVSSDKEAIDLMNDSNLGLSASIWTKDVAKGEELVEKVEAGTLFVNRCDYPSPDLAWTGWKDSGRGVTLGRGGFESFVRSRSWHLKNYPVGK
ncbi:ALDH-like protein [Terfezia boudieri ATCC MYA-4762]|uniref:aldehyde dehydrogenase (NAD(+)) n=1 Tax=Terfezia boudieri ATCC MYA-4762 TaxID=1051890 RepID=A0A3N4M065_9PEZI|nr:ALDH-like protein [Terfezia boudieri ATCC MYA-4762]